MVAKIDMSLGSYSLAGHDAESIAEEATFLIFIEAPVAFNAAMG